MPVFKMTRSIHDRFSTQSFIDAISQKIHDFKKYLQLTSTKWSVIFLFMHFVV